MICSKCGAEIQDDMKFCCFCGVKNIDIESFRISKEHYSQEEETQIIKHCRDLTAIIEIEEKELQRLEKEAFRARPNPPVKKIATVVPKYPESEKARLRYFQYSKIYWIIITILLFISVICWICNVGYAMFLVVYFGFMCSLPFSLVFWRKKLRKLNVELAKTPEYLNACERAEAYAKEQEKIKQNEYDKEFIEENNHYNSVIISQYDKDLEIWNIFKNRKIEVLKEEIILNKAALHNAYECTRLISHSYRDLSTLIWIYEDMSTSNHDLRYATELYDRDRQRAATEAVGLTVKQAVNSMEENVLGGLNAVYDAIEYGNSLEEKEISILSKIRNEQNLLSVIGIAQSFSLNKKLVNVLEGLEK